MKKKKYDSSVIMLYLLKQEHLLPKNFRKTIPYSTISSWRKSSYENYEGSQLRFLFDYNWHIIGLKQENQKLKKILFAFARSYVLLKPELQHFIKAEKEQKGFSNKSSAGDSNTKSASRFRDSVKIIIYPPKSIL